MFKMQKEWTLRLGRVGLLLFAVVDAGGSPWVLTGKVGFLRGGRWKVLGNRLPTAGALFCLGRARVARRVRIGTPPILQRSNPRQSRLQARSTLPCRPPTSAPHAPILALPLTIDY